MSDDETFLRRFRRRLGGWIVVALTAASPPCGARADPANGPRLALIVGNSAYAASSARTSVDDAALVAESLALVGFDVTAIANADRAALTQAIETFEASARAAGPKATILVYFAGFGMQRDGRAYFAPIGAPIERDADVPAEAVDVTAMTEAIEAIPASARVFVLDLARDNPFARADDRPLAAGLPLTHAPKGSLYAYDTAPDAAAPLEHGTYGAYARALSEMILTPGLPIATLFARVRLRAGELTDGAIVPWDDDGLVDAPPFLAAPAPIEAPAEPLGSLSASAAYSTVVARDTIDGYLDFLRVVPHDGLTARVRALAALRQQALFWAATTRDGDAWAYWTYMRRYPGGPHLFDARRRLVALKAPLEPPPRFDIVSFPDLPPPAPEDLKAFERPFFALDEPGWPAIPAPPVALLPPLAPALADGLPPPQILPDAVPPVSVPILPMPDAALGSIGAVTLEGAGPGPITARTTLDGGRGDPTVTLTRGSALISRAISARDGAGRRVVTQTGPDGGILSRTVIIASRQGATIVQTGPNGGVLSKSVTWLASDGGRETLVHDGGNRVVADIRRDAAGIVIATTGADEPAAPPRQKGTPQVSSGSAPVSRETPRPDTPPAASSAQVPISGTPPPSRPASGRAPTVPPSLLSGPVAAPTPSAVQAPLPVPRPSEGGRSLAREHTRPHAGPASRASRPRKR